MVLDHTDQVAFVRVEALLRRRPRYLPRLLVARNIDPEHALALLEDFESITHALDESMFVSMREEALARIERRDAEDWPVLSAALGLGLPIRTQDQDSFGTGVSTGRPTGSHVYLNATSIGEATRPRIPRRTPGTRRTDGPR